MGKKSITIVCSTIKSNHKQISHLNSTCGFSNAQIIVIENPGKMSLTQAYQQGLESAKNDIVVFVHDDVKFLTEGWGRKLVKLFEKSDFGIIGLAGTTSIPESGRWWEEREKMIGIVKHSDHKTTWENKYSGAFPNEIIPTLNTDGLFIAIDKTRIKKQWDVSIPGFHFYDMDFSFSNYLAGVKVGVTTDIRVLHYGLGETNEQWEINRTTFIEKYKENLPARLNPEPYNKINFESKKIKTPNVKILLVGKSPQKIKTCLDSIFDNCTYPNYSVVIGYLDYDDEELLIEDTGNVEVVNIVVDNYSSVMNQLVMDYVKDEELLVFITENTLFVNDVISHGVSVYNKQENCGTISTRIHNPDNSIYNVGYDMYNLIEVNLQDPNQGSRSQLIVNLIGQRSYYSFNNDLYYSVLGGTKDFIMVPTELFKEITFNESYREAFQDLELHVKSIQKNKKNFVMGYCSVKLQEEPVPTEHHNEDLNHRFLQFLQTVELRHLKDHIKEVKIPMRGEEQQ